MRRMQSGGVGLVLALVGVGAVRAGGSAAETITARELADHIGVLASDGMEGRGTGSPGERRAAAYLIERLQAAGLQPGTADGTWLQPFRVAGAAKLQDGASLSLQVGPWSRDLSLEKDWNPFGFTGSGQVDAPLVFAGYGIVDAKKGYDDYAGLDVKGKAVVVLRHQPHERDGTGPQAYFITKAKVAQEHGAAAIVIVTDPLNHPDDDTILPFQGEGSGEALAIPALHLRRSIAESMFRLAGQDLRQLQREIESSDQPRSRGLEGRLRVSLQVTRDDLTANNVVARLPGSDPALADEVLVIGAHYDHLGYGQAGGSLGGKEALGHIHNGADDNASGTAGLLELAQALVEARPRRTIYFVAFSGEELGLLGSQHFVEHPPLPRERIVAMINLDMIGRLKDGPLEVGGVGSSPGFTDLARRVLGELGVEGKFSRSGYGPSDHASFYAAKIPVLFFFTGLHGEYHKPDDDADLIDARGAERVVRAAFACAAELADAPTRPAYVEAPRPGRARLGIVIDNEWEGSGVRVREVAPQGGAAAAGVQSGDVIVRLDDQDVTETEDLLETLAEREPEQEVTLTVLRGQERVTLRVKLQGGR